MDFQVFVNGQPRVLTNDEKKKYFIEKGGVVKVKPGVFSEESVQGPPVFDVKQCNYKKQEKQSLVLDDDF